MTQHVLDVARECRIGADVLAKLARADAELHCQAERAALLKFGRSGQASHYFSHRKAIHRFPNQTAAQNQAAAPAVANAIHIADDATKIVGSRLGVRISNITPKKPLNVRISTKYSHI